MDNNTLALLGSVKLYHPETKQELVIEAQGFDVLGAFFPFFRLIAAGMWKPFAVYCVTFWAVPIWAWYMGFNFKKMNLHHHLRQGWKIDDGKEKPQQQSNVTKIEAA